MDYGKTAYYKLGELEKQLKSGLGAFKAVSITPGDFSSGKLAQLSGNGLVTVSLCASGGRISVLAGGVEMGSGEGDFTVSAVLCDCAITFTAEDGGRVNGARITACGSGVALSAPPSKLAGDSDGSLTLAATADGGEMKLFAFDGGAGRLVSNYGQATDFDIAVSGDALLCRLTPAAITLVLLNGSLEQIKGSVIPVAASLVAVKLSGGGMLAYYKGQTVYVSTLSADLQVTQTIAVHQSPNVKALGFIKGETDCRLLICDNDKCLMRRIDV